MEKTPRQSAVKQYFKDSWNELSKVSWPTKVQAVNICILVVSFVFVAAVIFAGVDYLFNKGYTYLLDLPVVRNQQQSAGAVTSTDGNAAAEVSTEPVTSNPVTPTPSSSEPANATK